MRSALSSPAPCPTLFSPQLPQEVSGAPLVVPTRLQRPSLPRLPCLTPASPLLPASAAVEAPSQRWRSRALPSSLGKLAPPAPLHLHNEEDMKRRRAAGVTSPKVSSPPPVPPPPPLAGVPLALAEACECSWSALSATSSHCCYGTGLLAALTRAGRRHFEACLAAHRRRRSLPLHLPRRPAART